MADVRTLLVCKSSNLPSPGPAPAGLQHMGVDDGRVDEEDYDMKSKIEDT